MSACLFKPDVNAIDCALFFSLQDAVAYAGAVFGEGSGPVYLDGVQCLGIENSLSDCTANTAPTCDHTRDAAVACSSTSKTHNLVRNYVHCHKIMCSFLY